MIMSTSSCTGHSTPTAFDHLCEASSVGGFETTLRSTPTPEAHLITVGESPMIALYKITKVSTWCAAQSVGFTLCQLRAWCQSHLCISIAIVIRQLFAGV